MLRVFLIIATVFARPQVATLGLADGGPAHIPYDERSSPHALAWNQVASSLSQVNGYAYALSIDSQLPVPLTQPNVGRSTICTGVSSFDCQAMFLIPVPAQLAGTHTLTLVTTDPVFGLSSQGASISFVIDPPIVPQGPTAPLIVNDQGSDKTGKSEKSSKPSRPSKPDKSLKAKILGLGGFVFTF